MQLTWILCVIIMLNGALKPSYQRTGRMHVDMLFNSHNSWFYLCIKIKVNLNMIIWAICFCKTCINEDDHRYILLISLIRTGDALIEVDHLYKNNMWN